jgi:sec-independent protein translocase protein TatC
MTVAHDRDMPLWQHFEELRWMLFRCIGVLALATLLGLLFTPLVYRALLYPVRDYLEDSIRERHLGKAPGEVPGDSRAVSSGDLAAVLDALADTDLSLERRVELQGRCILLLAERVGGLDLAVASATASRKVRIVYTSPVGPFTVKLKVAFLGGVVFAVPFICYFIWRFVSPAMDPRERRIAARALAVAVPLFLLGASFGYCFLPFGIPALMKFSAAGVEQIWPFKAYIGFCTRLVIAFGLVFEMPLVLGVLTRLGVVEAQTLAKGRPYAVVVFFVLAAFLTPPDVYSQIALAIPMLALYELSILVAKLQGRGRETA